VSSAASNANPRITIVIASLCNDARSGLLRRACDSIQAMAGGLDYSIMIVANGSSVSPRVLEWLRERPDVRLIQLHSGSHPLARRVGAEMARSELLGFIDDDDELMPDTLARKLAYFHEHPEVDVLVTDGLRINGSSVTRIFPPPGERSVDLVETMMRASWGAGALTLRTGRVDLAAFDAECRHMEWTLTTLQLARHHGIGYLDEPTYRYYEDTPNSLSKLANHNLAGPEVWRRLSKTYAGTRYEQLVRRRYGTVCHAVSWECSRRGNMRDAWRLHAESLRCPGGLAFTPLTAKLVLQSLRGESPEKPAAIQDPKSSAS
jgi:glycosyltransferase involved in cell wall biosynthesis